ncbi:MAG: hypothetical protein H0W82_05360 [Actinobacteria bacterium]|nr:hypothetical protein [Actinomycetota bacterium]
MSKPRLVRQWQWGVLSLHMGRLTSTSVLALIGVVLASACGGGTGSSDDGSASLASRSAPPAPQPVIGAPPWPAPPDPIARTVAAGLKPERKEFFAIHLHAHLDVFVNGEPVEVPAGTGIDITDPGVKRFEDAGGIGYGGIELCDMPCISPLHTHDTTGVLHTEAPENETNTLGEFFVEWGVRLDERCVGGFCEPQASIAVYVDGQRYDGDPAGIALENLREIAIVIGSFPREVPSTYDFSNA